MPRLTILAPAKINLHLRVKNARSDGFHSLRSIFLALSLGDTLCFEPLDSDGNLEIRMKPAIPAIPIEKNIIFKAISLFRAAAGFNPGLKVTVNKRIPLGAGLGGGSSDAAATLLALNTLAAERSFPGLPLDRPALASLAASLGSDVPFFLNLDKSCAAWVTGRGEKINPIEAAPEGLWFVLVYPGFSSETAAAFRQLDLFRAGEGRPAAGANSRAAARGADLPKSVLINALRGEAGQWPFENDFLPVFLRDAGVKKAYKNVLAGLKAEGAEFAGLSGAGSACFGVFLDKKSAVQAKNALMKAWNYVKVTFPLALGSKAVLQ